MQKYKFIEGPTSDIKFESYGKNPKELFENSAEALMSVVCNIKNVKTKKAISIKIKAENLKELMFKWLQEFIVLVDTKEMFFSKFNIEKIEDCEIKAEVYGEAISKEKARTLVKAVTYHKFDVSKDKKGYKARVVLDI